MKSQWIVVAAALSLLMYGCADPGMEPKTPPPAAPKAAAAAKPAAEPTKAEKAEMAAAGVAIDTEALYREHLVGKTAFYPSGSRATFFAP